MINRRQSAALLVSLGLVFHAQANGILENGVGARSMAMGGADVAYAADPLGAMGANPAGLGFLASPELDFGGMAGFVQGHFNKPGVSDGDLDNSPQGLPEFGFGMPVGDLPVSVGASFVPQSILLADWHYVDPPGGLNGTTSYGNQQDKSEIILLRPAIGGAVKINSKLSFGASVGLVYNENWLKAPYIFQNLQPGAGGPDNTAYNGAKTLLDLHTSGFGWNAQVGMIYRATTNLQFGVSYQSETSVYTTGDASGDPSTQFGAPQGTLPFHYNAAVRNIFPQEVMAGTSWRFHPKWRLALQVDWVDWADAFHTLPVYLSNGNNATVNSVLGSSFSDHTPLDWRSEFVYRGGIEYGVTDDLVLRLGFSHGNNPVPDGTLTPMTAAIVENTLTAGIGYRWRCFQFDLAYQFDIPQKQTVGTSDLRAGEYSNSSTEVSAHTFALTTSIRF